ncbi:ubiquitin-specific protease [Balamuthia mandrillaris]
MLFAALEEEEEAATSPQRELVFFQRLALREEPEESVVRCDEEQAGRCYLLSLRWWQQWKRSMRTKEEGAAASSSSSPSPLSMMVRPLQEGVPPINNFPLLNSYSFSLLHQCSVAVVLQKDRARARNETGSGRRRRRRRRDGEEKEDGEEEEEEEMPYYIQRLLGERGKELLENKCALREDLEEGRDYVWVFEPTWNILHRWCGGGPTLKAALVRSGMRQRKVLTLNPWVLKYGWGLTRPDEAKQTLSLQQIAFRPEEPLRVVRHIVCSKAWLPPHNFTFMAWNKEREPEVINLDQYDLQALTLQNCGLIEPQQTVLFLVYMQPADRPHYVPSLNAFG